MSFSEECDKLLKQFEFKAKNSNTIEEFALKSQIVDCKSHSKSYKISQPIQSKFASFFSKIRNCYYSLSQNFVNSIILFKKVTSFYYLKG